ncbi:cell division ATP-binding protein FtsE [Brackiella oedipodis]|uniref:cell division ATP-binding protein FtsE n=1 Tax=Brackiella oedipodis TaxID=124225 RepID=UPI00048C0A48|nr:ATP-binding cassette domain-containing protein [Brackiella oedipodis]
MIEFQHVFKSYGQSANVLVDLNFTIQNKEFVFISGPSGAGKSTLLKLIAGLEKPSRGRIAIKDQRLDTMSPRERPFFRRKVGVILQDTHLLYDRNALENVLLPLAAIGCSADEAVKRAQAALSKVSLFNKQKLNPIALSGGEQQRLAIARAIVNRPAILIADEPTANLDDDSAQRILEVFRDFNRVGVTTLIASHDRKLLHYHSNRTLLVEPGKFTDLGKH